MRKTYNLGGLVFILGIHTLEGRQGMNFRRGTKKQEIWFTSVLKEVEEEPQTRVMVPKSKPKSTVASTVEEEEGIELMMLFLRA
ncbi:hypothetical protein E1A91_A03G056800v1 [Gossypium mustelinum]|uniref:Uncharacterized protein n=1 Tax=Gossypium mustelinum TaxID=34275 RepID=A0A5D2ZUY1_GOSMU|nr:hypothetical protein E1A91_A03G056800v1 [Gossypium mustelinum]TYJ41975.1 hypothetical protein E1A91_A03G056800v1 [Gossypium mustelinum]